MLSFVVSEGLHDHADTFKALLICPPLTDKLTKLDLSHNPDLALPGKAIQNHPHLHNLGVWQTCFSPTHLQMVEAGSSCCWTNAKRWRSCTSITQVSAASLPSKDGPEHHKLEQT